MENKEFEVDYHECVLKFTFYTFDFILNDLQEIFGTDSVKAYDLHNHRKWSQIGADSNGNQYFTYIKFFVENKTGIKYGIVGGKTTYTDPDIIFDKPNENDNRIARKFLYTNNFPWHDTVIVIHHAKVSTKNDDDLQAKFIEKFVQRKYNLFDS